MKELRNFWELKEHTSERKCTDKVDELTGQVANTDHQKGTKQRRTVENCKVNIRYN